MPFLLTVDVERMRSDLLALRAKHSEDLAVADELDAILAQLNRGEVWAAKNRARALVNPETGALRTAPTTTLRRN